MKQPGMDSEFEAFRRDQKMRRRKKVQTYRPAGHDQVRDAIEASEAHDLQDRVINAEVDDFFSDATRMAATIVQRVTRGRERELTDQLRHEMEEFLAESIRHATSLMKSLPLGGENHGETHLDANLKNLDGRELDAFRAEGTAQLEDKHLGKNLFPILDAANPVGNAGPSPDNELVEASEHVTASTDGAGDQGTSGAEDAPVHTEIIAKQRMHISEGELSLEFRAEGLSFEPGLFVDQISGVGAIQSDEHPVLPPTVSGVYRADQSGPEPVVEDDLPLAALFEGTGEVKELAEKPGPIVNGRKPEVAGSVSTADKRKLIRETLLGLVRQGILTEQQARAAYLTQTGPL